MSCGHEQSRESLSFPTILAVVERQAPVSELVLTIVLFVVGMMLLAAASAYVNTNTIFGRITVRTELIAFDQHKSLHHFLSQYR